MGSKNPRQPSFDHGAGGGREATPVLRKRGAEKESPYQTVRRNGPAIPHKGVEVGPARPGPRRAPPCLKVRHGELSLLCVGMRVPAGLLRGARVRVARLRPTAARTEYVARRKVHQKTFPGGRPCISTMRIKGGLATQGRNRGGAASNPNYAYPNGDEQNTKERTKYKAQPYATSTLTWSKRKT